MDYLAFSTIRRDTVSVDAANSAAAVSTQWMPLEKPLEDRCFESDGGKAIPTPSLGKALRNTLPLAARGIRLLGSLRAREGF